MKTINKLFLFTLFAFCITSCEVEDGENLNGPSTDTITSDLSRGELSNTVSGVLSDMRQVLAIQTDVMSMFGREYWRFQSSEPRYTADVLTANLDNNTFYTTNAYSARYATIKDVNLILEGLENTTADFSAAELAGARGFLNTLKAHEFLMLLNQQFQNGIRLDVADENNLGPFVGYDEALTALSTMLADASADLAAGGDTFAFPVPTGFAGFDTPSSFNMFNKGLNARIEAYRGNYGAVTTLLGDSFLDMGGDLANGTYFTFSLSGADLANTLFVAQNSTVSDSRIAHPSFAADAEAGDERLAKAPARDEPITLANLTGTEDVFVYQSNTDPVPIMRNEELILLFAEANYQANSGAAIDAINVIRNAAGLADYTGSTAPNALLDEILTQRRYSLFAEGGHRWIDLRRFDRLGELPLDRSGDEIAVQLPTPANENRQ